MRWKLCVCFLQYMWPFQCLIYLSGCNMHLFMSASALILVVPMVLTVLPLVSQVILLVKCCIVLPLPVLGFCVNFLCNCHCICCYFCLCFWCYLIPCLTSRFSDVLLQISMISSFSDSWLPPLSRRLSLAKGLRFCGVILLVISYILNNCLLLRSSKSLLV